MIDRAAGCLPDGTVFRIPEQDLLPLPYQPRELTTPESHDIYLALPVATHNISEVQGIRSAGQSSSATAWCTPMSATYTAMTAICSR